MSFWVDRVSICFNILRHSSGKALKRLKSRKCSTGERVECNGSFFDFNSPSWSEVNFDDKIETEQQFLEQHIWHNSLIRIENRPVFYKHLFLLGITKVAQLMTDLHSFLPLGDFISTYNTRIQPIKYFGLISALGTIITLTFLVKKPTSTDTPNTFSETFIKNDKANRVFQKLLSFKSTVPFKRQEK